MRRANLAELSPPPPGKTGWPWTEESPQLPDTMPDGSPWPRISIVTPSYNQGQFIEETIRSVLLQGYPNLEYIIIDGGSSDGSVEIIKKYEPWLAYWVSEKDRGQSHAINKGLFRSTGEILAWLNSDDLLIWGSLAAAARVMAKINMHVPAIGLGRRIYIDADSTVTGYMSYFTGQTYAQWVAWGVSRGPMQESTFWNRAAWETYGPLNETLFAAFDLDFFLRVLSDAHESVFCRMYIGAWRLWGLNKCETHIGYVNGEVNAIKKRFRNSRSAFAHKFIRRWFRYLGKKNYTYLADYRGLPEISCQLQRSS